MHRSRSTAAFAAVLAAPAALLACVAVASVLAGRTSEHGAPAGVLLVALAATWLVAALSAPVALRILRGADRRGWRSSAAAAVAGAAAAVLVFLAVEAFLLVTGLVYGKALAQSFWLLLACAPATGAICGLVYATARPPELRRT